MARISGRKHVLGIGVDESTPPVIGTDDVLFLRNVDMSFETPEVPTTAAGDQWQKFVAGAAPGGTLSWTGVTNIEAGTPPQTWDEFLEGAIRAMAYYPEGTETGLPMMPFLGVILAWNMSAAYDGANEVNGAIRVTSEPTWDVVPAPA